MYSVFECVPYLRNSGYSLGSIENDLRYSSFFDSDFISIFSSFLQAYRACRFLLGMITLVFQKFLFPFNYWIVKIRLREEAFAFWRVLFIFYLALIFFQCDSPSHKPGYEYLFLYNHFRDLWSVIELNFLPYKWRYAR